MDLKKISHDKIIAALEERGATQPCARCGKQQFDVISTANISLQQSASTMVVGGPSIPSVYVGCRNCGSLAIHALGALGLLEE
ncbi:hypothetical protein AADU72_004187 [Vibrio vulnificus]